MPLTDIDAQRLGDSVADKLGVRNLIINGAVNVAQRGTSSTGVTSTGYHAADRWQLGVSNLGTHTVSQASDAPSGFTKSHKIECTTANTSPTASAYLVVHYHIEGQDLQQLSYGNSDAKALTISFYVKSNKTGNASFEIQQKDNADRQVSFQYTISSAATWEKKTISIPADTAGLINDDNGSGLRLGWWLNSGSTYSGGTHEATWASEVNANRNVSNLGVGGAVSDYFQITGVQLEVGNTATPFEHRSFADELARCGRYYQKSYNYSVAPGTATAIGCLRHRKNGVSSSITDFQVRLHPNMRAVPTVVIYSTSDGASGKLRNAQDSANVTASANDQGENGFHVVSNPSIDAHRELLLQYTAESEL